MGRTLQWQAVCPRPQQGPGRRTQSLVGIRPGAITYSFECDGAVLIFYISQIVALRYTFGDEVIADPYHVPMIRNTLNKNLAACFPEIREEIVQAFDEVLALEGNGMSFVGWSTNSYLYKIEWKAVPAMTTALTIVCRASNRLFVGYPLCEAVSIRAWAI